MKTLRAKSSLRAYWKGHFFPRFHGTIASHFVAYWSLGLDKTKRREHATIVIRNYTKEPLLIHVHHNLRNVEERCLLSHI